LFRFRDLDCAHESLVCQRVVRRPVRAER
jgi:hypothetical protein